MSNSIASFSEMQSRAVRLPFGKYKGLRLDEVPFAYCRWLSYQYWMRDDYPELFEHVETVYTKHYGVKTRKRRISEDRGFFASTRRTTEHAIKEQTA